MLTLVISLALLSLALGALVVAMLDHNGGGQGVRNESRRKRIATRRNVFSIAVLSLVAISVGAFAARGFARTYLLPGFARFTILESVDSAATTIDRELSRAVAAPRQNINRTEVCELDGASRFDTVVGCYVHISWVKHSDQIPNMQPYRTRLSQLGWAIDPTNTVAAQPASPALNRSYSYSKVFAHKVSCNAIYDVRTDGSRRGYFVGYVLSCTRSVTYI